MHFLLLFEKLGGKVIYFGKPHPEVYKQSIINKGKKIIAIGDNLKTDIKGAINMNYDSLFITQGIHKNEIQKEVKKKTMENHLVDPTEKAEKAESSENGETDNR